MTDATQVDTPVTSLLDQVPEWLLAYRQKVLEGMELAQKELEHVAKLEQQIIQFRGCARSPFTQLDLNEVVQQPGKVIGQEDVD